MLLFRGPDGFVGGAPLPLHCWVTCLIIPTGWQSPVSVACSKRLNTAASLTFYGFATFPRERERAMAVKQNEFKKSAPNFRAWHRWKAGSQGNWGFRATWFSCHVTWLPLINAGQFTRGSRTFILLSTTELPGGFSHRQPECRMRLKLCPNDVQAIPVHHGAGCRWYT